MTENQRYDAGWSAGNHLLNTQPGPRREVIVRFKEQVAIRLLLHTVRVTMSHTIAYHATRHRSQRAHTHLTIEPRCNARALKRLVALFAHVAAEYDVQLR
jgi:hypothetical protein